MILNDITYSFGDYLFFLSPPILTIAIAFIFRQVIIALFAGITLGIFLHHGVSFEALFSIADTYALNTLTDRSNMSVILFSLLIGGMVFLLRKNGSLNGVVKWISALATSAVSAQFSVWLMGVFIFFDDYANSLVVGNTMRSVTDKYHISREKLAYIVDSTAAPVASIAFMTTWVGTQMKYFSEGAELLKMDVTGPIFFTNSLSYAFYPILTLVFILFIIFLKKDYGPMYAVELNARKSQPSKEGVSKNSAKNGTSALIPILTLIFVTLAGIYFTGRIGLENVNGTSDKLLHLLKNCDPYVALIWGSFSALLIAIVLSLFPLMMKLKDIVKNVLSGFSELLETLIVLVLAWVFSDVLRDLGTDQFLGGLIGHGVNPIWLPVLIFLLAGLTSFATGSSWSTMAILYPIVWNICDSAEIATTNPELVYHIGSLVLAGSVFGDHCSPISDTTILSSMASGCDHVSHVRTQIPYALTVAGVSLLLSMVATLTGMPVLVNYMLGVGILFGAVHFFGRRVE